MAALLVAASLSPAVGAEVIVGQAAVIDGDRIEIDGRAIRLWGIDAPEPEQSCEMRGAPTACGRRSAEALARLIDGKPLRCTVLGEDREQTLARCYVASQDIGGWMVQQGHALDWARHSGGRYAPYMEQAQEAKRGVWAGTFTLPWEWRARQGK